MNRRNLPKGVDEKNLEKHLSEEEFVKVFSMTREAFYKIPSWRQEKVKVGLHMY